MPEAGRVQLRLHDLAGRLLATLIEGGQPAGRHRVTWDARSALATRRAGGVYFARLSLAGRTTTRTVIVLER